MIDDVIIEKAEHNYSAYIKGVDGIVSSGETLDSLKCNIVLAIYAFSDECRELKCDNPFADEYKLSFKMDVKSFLDFYNGIFSKSGLERISGINQKQLWHYASGGREPRPETAGKLEEALHQLGRELLEIKFK